VNDLLSHLQSLAPHPAVVVTLVVAVVVLVIYEPVSGRRSHARFVAEEAVHGEAARLRFYRSWTLQGCASAVAAILLVLALPGVGLGDIGFRVPDVAGLDRFGITGGSTSTATLAGMLTGLLIAIVAVVVLGKINARKAAGKPAKEPQGQMKAILPMLPRTSAGRRGWAMLSLSAGVTEEITYRGLILLTLAVALPDTTPRPMLIVVAAVLFGVAHWYQGWAGILTTGFVGGVMAGLYLSTGSLLIVMVLHTLIDLRALLLPVPAATADEDKDPAGRTPATA
jgi:uncharacterized protein